MKPPLVSYIVITMNRRDELSGCLSNLLEQDYPSKQIIVVDNGSADNTVETVAAHFPVVDLIALETNEGVGGGRNRGVAFAEGEICIFIDDDARLVDRQATRHTVAYFQADPQLACVAFLIRNACIGAEDAKAIPRSDKQSIKEDYSCNYFCGTGFALRRRVFIKLGMFWEKLFYAGEELDFSYRLLDKGYRLIHTGGIVVDHHEVHSSRFKGQWVYFNARNRCWIAAKNLPWFYVVSTSVLWWAYTALVDLNRGHCIYFLRGFRDAIRGLPEVLQERRCIGKKALRRLKAFSGRRWY